MKVPHRIKAVLAGSLAFLANHRNLVAMGLVAVLVLMVVSLKDLASGLADLGQSTLVCILFACVIDSLMVFGKITWAFAKDAFAKSKSAHDLDAMRKGSRVVKVTALVSGYMNAKAFCSVLLLEDAFKQAARWNPSPENWQWLGNLAGDTVVHYAQKLLGSGIPLYPPLAYAIFLGLVLTYLIYLGGQYVGARLLTDADDTDIEPDEIVTDASH